MPQLVSDILRFLDNVLSKFIEEAGPAMASAVYSASRERSVGLGVMGYHTLFQQKGWSLSDDSGHDWNTNFFSRLRECANRVSYDLAGERGSCPDAEAFNIQERFSHKLAIAPTATISIICGGVSPGIDPIYSNAYLHKTKTGSIPVRNPNLMCLLDSYGKGSEDIWSSIVQREGSIEHLSFLTPQEKSCFSTAFEIDALDLVKMAGDRASFICQGQSLNFFLNSNISKSDLLTLHMKTWKNGCKGAYYCRTKSPQRVENISSAKEFTKIIENLKNKEMIEESINMIEECSMCA
jgi:ribonucleoside-diphosphate reductase alpha chain